MMSNMLRGETGFSLCVISMNKKAESSEYERCRLEKRWRGLSISHAPGDISYPCRLKRHNRALRSQVCLMAFEISKSTL